MFWAPASAVFMEREKVVEQKAETDGGRDW